MSNAIAVFNAGSSSVRFALYRARADGRLAEIASGQVECLGSTPRLLVHTHSGEKLIDRHWRPQISYAALIADLITWIDSHVGDDKLCAVGHRIVHGGPHYTRPVLIDQQVEADLQALAPLAPLHQPHHLAAITAIARHAPRLPQVACFDTGFHATAPALTRLYALPEPLAHEGVLRYGFHGLSCEYVIEQLKRHAPGLVAGRVIIAHLGAGASLTAVQAGQSIANTMGFSTLDGLPMATRCGSLDPGVLLYLLREHKLDVHQLEDLLYRQSGLLGLSGSSGDMRALLASQETAAVTAIQHFVYRINREIGSLVAALGGLDALIFTAGVGENSPRIRADICAAACWLGLKLDADANAASEAHISTNDSPVSVWVIPTDENRVIAEHTWHLARPS